MHNLIIYNHNHLKLKEIIFILLCKQDIHTRIDLIKMIDKLPFSTFKYNIIYFKYHLELNLS